METTEDVINHDNGNGYGIDNSDGKGYDNDNDMNDNDNDNENDNHNENENENDNLYLNDNNNSNDDNNNDDNDTDNGDVTAISNDTNTYTNDNDNTEILDKVHEKRAAGATGSRNVRKGGFETMIDNDDLCNSEERGRVIGLIREWMIEIPTINITNDTDIYGDELFLEVIEKPIVILRNFLRHKRLKLNRISLLHEMIQSSNDQNITVLRQDLGVHGWKNIFRNTSWEKCTFNDYIMYAKRLEKLLDVASKFCVDVPLSCLDMAILAMDESEQVDDTSCYRKTVNKQITKTKQPSNRIKNVKNDVISFNDPFIISASFTTSSAMKPWFSDISVMLALAKKKKRRDKNIIRRPRLLQQTFVSWPNISRADFRAVNEAFRELEQMYENSGDSDTDINTQNHKGIEANTKTRPMSFSSVFFESTYSTEYDDDVNEMDKDDNDDDSETNERSENILKAILLNNKDNTNNTFAYHQEIHSFPDLPHKRRTPQTDDSDSTKSLLVLELFVGPRGMLCLEIEFKGILLYYSSLKVHDPSISVEGLSRRSREKTLTIVEERLLEYMAELHEWLNGNNTETPGRAVQDELLFLLTNSNGFAEEICQSSNHLSVFDTEKDDSASKKRTRGNSNAKPVENVVDNNTSLKINGIFKGKIAFGSNLNLSYLQTYQESLKSSFPAWMMCSSDDDMLKRLRQNVEGVNTPQIYVKVPGAWTGGHEENNRLRSINCNDGPGSSEWFSVESKYFNEVKALVFRDYQVDILRNEGSWFPDPAWFAIHNIPFMHGIQKPGDVVILKGATLHWVRSLGFATHYSWNIGLFMELDQMKSAIERYQINEELTKTGNAFQNLFPIKTFALDVAKELLNYVYVIRQSNTQEEISSIEGVNTGVSCILNNEELSFCYVEQLIYAVNEMDVLLEDCRNSYDGISVQVETESSQIIYCEHKSCRREIFEAYMYCQSCKSLCLRCSVDYPCVRKKNGIQLHGREIYSHEEASIFLKSDLQAPQRIMNIFIDLALTCFPDLQERINEAKLKARQSLQDEIHLRGKKRIVAKGFKAN